jgi:ABC-type transport system involved in multi-copper enzyme maturation permease subunit
MRAYIAIIKDSFREALASRVLWILLAVTTVVLLAAAPLALNEQRATALREDSILDWNGLVASIAEQRAADKPSPGRRIWSLASEELQQAIDRQNEPPAEEFPIEWRSTVLDGLNDVLDKPDLYDATAWQSVRLNPEARELLNARNKPQGDDIVRLNRLLFEAAYPDSIAASPRTELFISYLGYTLGEPLAIPRSQANTFVKSSLAGVMDLFVGTLGVFVAILVTAPIVPHTFEPGAVDLLLSKPISRSLLFLTKFLGGCVFILLNASYFVFGLWLIMGLRFDLWMGKLLLCIPLFLFLFAVYYSVSAIAGVLWRNVVVSIVVTILFWGLCFLVANVKDGIEQLALNPNRITQLVPAGDELFGRSESGRVFRWRGDGQRWERTFAVENDPGGGPFAIPVQLIGPVYDARSDRLVALQIPVRVGFSFFMPDVSLWLGNRSDDWKRTAGPAPPRGASALFVNRDGAVIAVAGAGVFRLEPVKADGERPADARGSFVSLGPPALRLNAPFAAALHASSDAIAIWDRATVTVLQPNEAGDYEMAAQREIADASGSAVLAFGRSTLLAASEDGRVRLLDAGDLSLRHEFRPFGGNQPFAAEASPDGRYVVVVFHHRKIWLYDAERDRPVDLPFAGHRDISAALFTAPNRLLLVNRGQNATEYVLDPFAVQKRREPAMRMIERIYRFAVVPAYIIFPKPGQLGNAVRYLLTDQETISAGANPGDLRSTRVKLDVKGPIRSSAAFLAVMLVLGCLYVRRADF